MLKNYHHNTWVRKLRSIARKVGILKLIKFLLGKRQETYEESFYLALKSAVAPGDTVWDIGANVGFYTNHFLNWAGVNGKVVAFEPLPKAFEILYQTIELHQFSDKSILECVALSDKPGQAFLGGELEDSSITTTAHLADSITETNGILVKVSTPDLMVKKENLPLPNVVKIDVEGFEEEVLRGGEYTFSHQNCHHILIEMHFARMDERNLGDSAFRIFSMLKKWGYSVNWVDSSHLHAKK